MPTVPISQFEHRVAQWSDELKRTREPLEISQRGNIALVVLDRETFEEWKNDRERLQALEIRLLVDAGERAARAGKVKSHAAVGRLVRKPRRARRAR
jgi:PHD/YefM family antitoxin component YafN of YafNO toxin-antitoxin module